MRKIIDWILGYRYQLYISETGGYEVIWRKSWKHSPVKSKFKSRTQALNFVKRLENHEV